MSGTKIALHMGMVRKHLREQGIGQTIRYTSQSGIAYGILPVCLTDEKKLEEAKSAMEETGVRLIGMEVVYGSGKRSCEDYDLQKDEDQIIAAAKKLGVQDICIAEMPDAFLEGSSQIRAICQEWNALCERLEQEGLKLVYQVHNEEFEKVQGKYILDEILDATEKLLFGIDTFWVHMGGQFVDEWIQKLGSRCEFLNVQDIKVKTPKGSHLVRSLLLDDSVKSAEAGEGNLNFRKIITSALEANVSYLCICQENTYDRTPFESVGRNKKTISLWMSE